MSEEEFEVPSPHDRLVEEAAEHDQLAQRVALTTAILATIGALFSYQSGSAQTEAMFLKNQSILRQSEASDQWAFYQARSGKAHLDDVAATLATNAGDKARFLADRDREGSAKAALEQKALALQAESRHLGVEAEAVLRPHHHMALGMTLIQIAVALASITVLTRKRWLFWGALGAALAGIVTAVSGFI